MRSSGLDLVQRDHPSCAHRRWQAGLSRTCEASISSPSRSSARVDAAIGGIAGLASGLLGVGGGFLIVPFQILWSRTEPHRASGTSLAAILPIALVAASVYYFGRVPGQVDFRVAFFLVIGSTVGAYVGARLIARVPERTLKIIVASLLLVVALDEIVSGLLPGVLLAGHYSTPMQLAAWQYALITAAGLLIGTLSGVTGVGGGIFLVPTLVLGFGLSHHLAQGTSLVAILPTAAVGAFTHFRRGNVDVRTAARIGVAGIPPALVGAFLALSLPQAALAVLFGFLLLFAASRIWPTRTPLSLIEGGGQNQLIRGEMTQEPPTNMQEYFLDFGLRLGRLMKAHGLESEAPVIEPRVTADILALAGTVAHSSERKFAPIGCFAAGIAVGKLQAAGQLSRGDDVAAFLARLRRELELYEAL